MSVVGGVELNLADLASRSSSLAVSALAQSALELARQMDDPGNSATSKSMCAKALMETLERLYSMAPPKMEQDGVDDLSDRRAARLEGRSAAKH